MNKFILVSLILVIVFSGVIVVDGQQDPGDEIRTVPSQYIEPGSGSDLTKVFIDIFWNEAGNGIYFHLEFNSTVSGIMIVNSTTKYHLQTMGGAITEDLAVNGILVFMIDDFENQFILPYEDTFSFFIFHSAPTWCWMEGWYAKDTQVPEPVVTGLNEGANILKGVDIDINAYYEPDRFNITELQVNRGFYPVKVETVNTDGPIDWNVTISTNSMPYGDNYISLIVRDGAGNEGQLDINFYIPAPYTPPPPIDFIFVYSLIGFFAVIGVVIGLVSYRNTYMNQDKLPKKEKRPYTTHSKDGKPYKKKHRDKKGYKKSS